MIEETETIVTTTEAAVEVREIAVTVAAAVIIAMKREMKTEIQIGEKEDVEAAVREMTTTMTTGDEEGTVTVTTVMTVTDAVVDENLQECIYAGK